VVGPELEAAVHGADGPLALVERQVHPGLVEQEIGVRTGAPERLIAHEHAQVAVPLDQDERQAVPGHVARVARVPPVGPLERHVGGGGVAAQEGRDPLLERPLRAPLAGALLGHRGQPHAFRW
jgi:hypothetical protein